MAITAHQKQRRFLQNPSYTNQSPQLASLERADAGETEISRAMSCAAGSRKRSRSASAIVADMASGYHVLRIDGYSRTKGTPNGEYLKSIPFTVGGHRWYILYYPNGYSSESADYVSLFLRLAGSVTEAVKAQFKIRFLRGVAEDSLIQLGEVHSFDSKGRCWGYSKFIKREDLEKSEHLQDDAFAVRCDVAVIGEICAKEETLEGTTRTFVTVPPSDLHQHLGNLLQTEKGADVVFNVGSLTFAAHRCVLAARSPVFSAEPFGEMKEGDTGCVVDIDDMEPEVFKALLHFIYTDMFPEAEKEDEGQQEDVMSQHLLVAADRYNLERLKLVCEEKLCKYISDATVGTILALAGQHHCHGLKKACFDFLGNSENLKAVAATEGFKHLSRSCPAIMEELIAMLGNLVQ